MPRCCGKCGRWGNRAYLWDAEREVWVCSNDRACRLRAVRVIPPVETDALRPQAWDDPAGRIRDLEAELHRTREDVAAVARELEEPRIQRPGMQRRRTWASRLRRAGATS